MNLEEALEFINWLFHETEKPCLNELEKVIFTGIWEGKTYPEICGKTFHTEQYLREAGANLCKKLQNNLAIKVSKRNFKNPIEYRYKQDRARFQASQKTVVESSNSAEQEVLKSADTSPLEQNVPRRGNTIHNPFTPQQGRVDNPQLFFNREREIRRVFEVLNSGSSVALIGEEGIGKSSLLWAICRQAENNLQLPRKPVYLDLNGVHDEDDFYSALCDEVGISESKGYRLTRNLQDCRVLLAIDNVGKMTWKGFTRQVRDQLRGLAEGSEAPLRLILAASEPLDKLFNDSQDEGKTSPLAGICQEETIKPWNESTTRAFIESRLATTSVRFTEEQIIQLVQESGGHPQRLMKLCYQTYSWYVEGEQ